jgi:hypothetical protein
MRKELYNERFEEEKLACKERANWQCEAILPWTGQRCPTRDGDEKWSRRSKRKWIVYLHAAHINNDPENPTPELMCLCPSCHMRMDRQKENAERPTQRRRGYELTSTDRLIEAVGEAGVTVTAISEGYHWRVEGMPLEGNTNTAVSAVGRAIACMRTELLFKDTLAQRNHSSPQKREPIKNAVSAPMTSSLKNRA